MRKILLLTTLLFTQFAFSQVVDVFNYTGTLIANGWTTHSGATPGQIVTASGSLSYTGLAASTGNKAILPNLSEDINIPISGISGTGYTSFLMSVPSTSNTSTATGGAYFYGFGATAGASLTSLYGRVWIKQGVAANTFKLGLSNTGNTAVFTSAEYAVNTTLFVVVSLDTTVTPYAAKLYVNPTPGAAAPTATLSDATGTGTITNFASLFLRQASGTGDIEIDEIRAGSTFASVTPTGATGCAISASGITALTCNDNGTGSITTDDYLTFSLNPTGATLGTSYTVSVPTGTITPTTGTYGVATSFQLQGGSAGAGNVTVTLTDDVAAGCTFAQLITDPGACSSAIPVITLAPSALTGFDHTVGTPSAEQTFTASGLSLTSDITITAPTNYQISLTTGAGFTNSLVLAQTAGVVANTTIHVRANATAAGSVVGNIIATSTGALNDTVNVSGTAFNYTYYTIDQVSTVDALGVADSLGVLVELTGVIHCIDFDGNAGYSLTMIDGSGSGINLFSFVDVSGVSTIIEGDSVKVFGEIAQYNGLLEVAADSVIILSQGAMLMPPTIVTTLGESTESQIIRMDNLTLVTPMATFATGSSNVDVTDGTNTFVMRIDSDTDIPGSPAPQGLFSVIGVGGQFDSSSPYDSGYQIFPCGMMSIMPACTVPSNATTTTSTTTASANAMGPNITYQWIDCASGSAVPGANTQSFTAAVSGSFAVIVADGPCNDTSACITLVGTNGIDENVLNSVRVYPNPVTDLLTIDNSSNSVLTFNVLDINGREITSNTTVSNTTTISTSTWNAGVYFIHFVSNKGEAVLKVLK